MPESTTIETLNISGFLRKGSGTAVIFAFITISGKFDQQSIIHGDGLVDCEQCDGIPEILLAPNEVESFCELLSPFPVDLIGTHLFQS